MEGKKHRTIPNRAIELTRPPTVQVGRPLQVRRRQLTQDELERPHVRVPEVHLAQPEPKQLVLLRRARRPAGAGLCVRLPGCLLSVAGGALPLRGALHTTPLRRGRRGAQKLKRTQRKRFHFLWQ